MAVVAEEVDMGQEQEMANLNSLTAGGLQEPVSVSLLYLYFKLVVIDKGKPLLWTSSFFLLRTGTCRRRKHVGGSAFVLSCPDEQVPGEDGFCG